MLVVCRSRAKHGPAVPVIETKESCRTHLPGRPRPVGTWVQPCSSLIGLCRDYTQTCNAPLCPPWAFPMTPPPCRGVWGWKWTVFFSVQAPLLCAEAAAGRWLRRRHPGVRVPQLLCIVVTLVVLEVGYA